MSIWKYFKCLYEKNQKLIVKWHTISTRLKSCNEKKLSHSQEPSFHALPVAVPKFQRCNMFPTCHNLPASGACKALLVVSIAKCWHHFSLHIVITDGALGTKLALIVCCAVIAAIFTEEATLGQWILAHCNDETNINSYHSHYHLTVFAEQIQGNTGIRYSYRYASFIIKILFYKLRDEALYFSCTSTIHSQNHFHIMKYI